MDVEAVSPASSLGDVVERVLDKGIVIDASVRVSVVGLDLLSVDAVVVVASVRTYLDVADEVGRVGSVSRSMLEDANVARRWRAASAHRRATPPGESEPKQ